MNLLFSLTASKEFVLLCKNYIAKPQAHGRFRACVWHWHGIRLSLSRFLGVLFLYILFCFCLSCSTLLCALRLGLIYIVVDDAEL